MPPKKHKPSTIPIRMSEAVVSELKRRGAGGLSYDIILRRVLGITEANKNDERKPEPDKTTGKSVLGLAIGAYMEANKNDERKPEPEQTTTTEPERSEPIYDPGIERQGDRGTDVEADDRTDEEDDFPTWPQ